MHKKTKIFLITYFLLHILGVGLFLYFTNSVTADYNNVAQEVSYPLPQWNNLNDVYFVDNSEGFMVGDNCQIMRTDDGGSNWKNISPNNCGDDLKSVFFINSNKGFAVGGKLSPVILKTTNGGQTWDYLTTGDSYPNMNTFKQIIFVNENVGFIAGDKVILKTTDGGLNWQVSYTANTNFNSVYFINPNDGYAVSNADVVIKTTNGGVSWTNISNNIMNRSNLYTNLVYMMIPKMLNYVYFADSLTGYIVGDGLILKTVNGGNSWYEQTIDLEHYNFSKIYFKNINDGFVIGRYGFGGALYRTVNGGQTWLPANISDNNPNAVIFKKVYAGFDTIMNSVYQLTKLIVDNFCKFPDTCRGSEEEIKTKIALILATTDDVTLKQVWNQMVAITSAFMSNVYDSAQFENLQGIGFTRDGSRGYVVAEKSVIAGSVDSGNSWSMKTSLYNIPNYSASNEFQKIKMVNENIGYAIGKGSSLYKTVNGGKEWTKSSAYIYNPNDIAITSSSGVVIASNNGAIWYSEDTGETWMNSGLDSKGLTKNYNYNYSSIVFTDRLTGYVAGENSGKAIMQKTEDGGKTWNPVNMPLIDALTAVYFVDGNNGFVISKSGRLLSTINGGKNWGMLETNKSNTSSSIFFINSKVGFVVGSNDSIGSGFVKKTIDGGTTWSDLNLIPNQSSKVLTLKDIKFIDINNGYIVGCMDQKGVLFKTIDGGTNWIYEYSHSKCSNSIDLVKNSSIGFIANSNGLASFSGGLISNSETLSFDSTYKEIQENDTTPISVNISRTGANSSDIEVEYLISGNAINGTDYQSLPAKVTIPAGQTSASITIQTIDNTIFEGNKNLTLTLNPISTANYVFGNKTFTLKIIENDPIPPVIPLIKLTAGGQTTEGGNFSFTIKSYSGASLINVTNPTKVYYDIAGTAEVDKDYQPMSGSFTINASSNAAPAQNLITIDNITQNPTKSVYITLRPGDGYTLDPATSSVKIDFLDNDDSSQPLAIKWTFTDPLLGRYGGRSSTAISADGTIYFIASDDSTKPGFDITKGRERLFAIDKNGTKKWDYYLPSYDITNPPVVGADGTVYVVNGYKVYAFTPDGTKKWETLYSDYIFEGNPPMLLKVAVGFDCNIYALGYKGVYGINADTGEFLWHYNFGRWVSYPRNIIIGNGNIIYAVIDNDVYAWDSSGNLKWKKTINESYGGGVGELAIGSGGLLYFGTATSMQAIDPNTCNATTCDVKYSNTGSSMASWSRNAPIIAPDNNVFINKTNAFYALTWDLKTKLLDSYSYPGYGVSPVIDQNYNIIGCTNGGRLDVIDWAKKDAYKTSYNPTSNSTFSLCEPSNSLGISEDGTIYMDTYDGIYALKGVAPSYNQMNWYAVNGNMQRNNREGNGNCVKIDTSNTSSGSLVNLSTITKDADEETLAKGKIRVTRSGTDFSLPLTIKYNVKGTATNSVDYNTLSGTVIIQAGNYYADIDITPINDNTFESDENVIVTLLGSPEYIVGTSNNAIVVIHNNDPQPTVSVVSKVASGYEGNNVPATFEIKRTTVDLATPMLVSYNLSGTATNGEDYEYMSGAVIIPAGSGSVLLNIIPKSDTVFEATETVIITLNKTYQYTLGLPATTTSTVSIIEKEGSIKCVNNKSASVYYTRGNPAFDSKGDVYFIGSVSTSSYLIAMSKDTCLNSKYALPKQAINSEVVINSKDQIIIPTVNFIYTYTTTGVKINEFDLSKYAGSTSTTYSFRSVPAIGPDDTIYVGAESNSNDGVFLAINPDASLKWKYVIPFDKAGVRTSPVISRDGTVYFTTLTGNINFGGGTYYQVNGKLIALTPDGNLKWARELGTTISPTIGTNETIYVNCGANICAVSKEGKLLWKSTQSISTDNPIMISPDNSKLYVGITTQLMTYILDSATGEVKNYISYPSSHDASHTILANGDIVIGNVNSITIYRDDNNVITKKWEKSDAGTNGKLFDISIGKDNNMYILTDAQRVLELFGSNPISTTNWSKNHLDFKNSSSLFDTSTTKCDLTMAKDILVYQNNCPIIKYIESFDWKDFLNHDITGILDNMASDIVWTMLPNNAVFYINLVDKNGSTVSQKIMNKQELFGKVVNYNGTQAYVDYKYSRLKDILNMLGNQLDTPETGFYVPKKVILNSGNYKIQIREYSSAFTLLLSRDVVVDPLVTTEGDFNSDGVITSSDFSDYKTIVKEKKYLDVKDPIFAKNLRIFADACNGDASICQ